MQINFNMEVFEVVVLKWGLGRESFAPRRHLVMSQDISVCQNSGTAKNPTLHKAAPHQNYPTRNVNRAEEARLAGTKSASVIGL